MEAETRGTVLTLRVNVTEEREFRLAAKAERISLSELIRRAVRDRAEQLATTAAVGPQARGRGR